MGCVGAAGFPGSAVTAQSLTPPHGSGAEPSLPPALNFQLKQSLYAACCALALEIAIIAQDSS